MVILVYVVLCCISFSRVFNEIVNKVKEIYTESSVKIETFRTSKSFWKTLKHFFFFTRPVTISVEIMIEVEAHVTLEVKHQKSLIEIKEC